VAPGIAMAQAIGRWGNYFNQELFGKPTTLPWGLEISPVNRPAGYESFATFHPVFLYESLSCIVIALVLVWADHRFKMGHGRVFALYVALYCLFRGPIENIRIDEAHHILGIRLNVFTSLVVGLVALGYFVRSSERYRGREFMRDGQILAGRRRAEVPTDGTGGKRRASGDDVPASKPVAAAKADKTGKPEKAGRPEKVAKRKSDTPEPAPVDPKDRAEVAAAVSADVSRLLEEIQAARAKGTQVTSAVPVPPAAPVPPPAVTTPAVTPSAPPAAPRATPAPTAPVAVTPPTPEGKQRGRRLKGK
jgi:hypothetical protein